jgi:hypothetical protein
VVDTEPQPEIRKRGAQRGNTNAIKHGAYSRWFRQLELSDLDLAGGPDLHDEIAMLRVVMQRLFEQVSAETPDIETMVKALTVLGQGAYHLGRLMKTEKDINGEKNEFAAKLTRAISGVITELEK